MNVYLYLKNANVKPKYYIYFNDRNKLKKYFESFKNLSASFIN